MNILVWCSLVKTSGGSERVAASLASGLSQRRHNVLLVGPYDAAPADLQRRIHPDVTVISYLSPGGIRGLTRNRALLRSFTETHAIDVISAHGSILSLLSVPVPVVWTEHSVRNVRRRMMSSARAPFWWAVRSRLIAKRWHVAAVSQFILDDLRRQMGLPAGCGEVIYNGIPDAGELSRLAPPKLSPPFQIGCIGRLDAEKSPQDIFELSRRLQAAGIPCEWHFFGEGELKPRIRARAEAEGEGRIHVHGYVDSITEAFSRIDALVLPSRMEGLPTVVLEAKIARRLIFAWKVGGVAEAAAADSVLVPPPFDPKRLAGAIIGALRAPALPLPYSGDCDFDGMVSSYLSLFEEIVKGRPASARLPVAPEWSNEPFHETSNLVASTSPARLEHPSAAEISRPGGVANKSRVPLGNASLEKAEE